MSVAEITGLTKSFGGVHAVNDVTFAIHENEILGIIGPNGAGKTALINTITGFYPADAGSIRFGGTDITHLPMHRIGRLGIARTFQNIRLFRRMTVIENVMVAAQSYVRAPFRALIGFRRRKADIARALEHLESVGLAGKADAAAGSLPYGDARRLEIARALATEPKLLLLDEPAAGMNEAESATLVENIIRLRSRLAAIVLIEHDMSVVRGLADRLLALDVGRIVVEGEPAAVLRHPLVAQAYLGEEAHLSEEAGLAEHP
jgi:branched-chain amino acid transport system ATP-binding protein